MKKILLLIVVFSLFGNLYSQTWVKIDKTNPDYSFSVPGQPLIRDTMNIRIAYFKSDSTAAFQVIEFKDTPLDSTNAGFVSALQESNGDTLMALVHIITGVNNALVTNSQVITTFPAYKGLEVSMSYSNFYPGRNLIVHTRFFYNIHSLLAFSITGTDDHLTQLESDKDIFFNSIAF